MEERDVPTQQVQVTPRTPTERDHLAAAIRRSIVTGQETPGQMAERILNDPEWAARSVPVAEGLREAIEYAAESNHERDWGHDNQGGHTERDWRKCGQWPCSILATTPEQPAVIDVERRLAVSARDLADTHCFLSEHARPSDQSACGVCEEVGETMFSALAARLGSGARRKGAGEP